MINAPNSMSDLKQTEKSSGRTLNKELSKKNRQLSDLRMGDFQFYAMRINAIQYMCISISASNNMSDLKQTVKYDGQTLNKICNKQTIECGL